MQPKNSYNTCQSINWLTFYRSALIDWHAFYRQCQIDVQRVKGMEKQRETFNAFITDKYIEGNTKKSKTITKKNFKTSHTVSRMLLVRVNTSSMERERIKMIE